VLDKELAAAVEQIGKRDPAYGSIKDVVLVNPDPGQPPPFGGERIAKPSHISFSLARSEVRAFNHSSRDAMLCF
jgi:hypothetical protein